MTAQETETQQPPSILFLLSELSWNDFNDESRASSLLIRAGSLTSDTEIEKLAASRQGRRFDFDKKKVKSERRKVMPFFSFLFFSKTFSFFSSSHRLWHSLLLLPSRASSLPQPFLFHPNWIHFYLTKFRCQFSSPRQHHTFVSKLMSFSLDNSPCQMFRRSRIFCRSS